MRHFYHPPVLHLLIAFKQKLQILVKNHINRLPHNYHLIQNQPIRDRFRQGNLNISNQQILHLLKLSHHIIDRRAVFRVPNQYIP